MNDLEELARKTETLSPAQLYLVAASVADKSPELAITLAERASNLLQLRTLFPRSQASTGAKTAKSGADKS